MDPKEERKARIAAARANRLEDGRNMFSKEVTVRQPPLGVPNLGYLKNPQNNPRPEFLNSTVPLNILTRIRPEWSGKAYTTRSAQRLNTPNYGPRVPSVRNTYNEQQIGPEYVRPSNARVVSQYRRPIKGTTGVTEPTNLTSNNALKAVNRAKRVEKEVGAFPEGVVRAPEVPAPGATGCFGGSCWPWPWGRGWGGNMKKTRNRRKTKKNTRRRSTRWRRV